MTGWVDPIFPIENIFWGGYIYFLIFLIYVPLPGDNFWQICYRKVSLPVPLGWATFGRNLQKHVRLQVTHSIYFRHLKDRYRIFNPIVACQYQVKHLALPVLGMRCIPHIVLLEPFQVLCIVSKIAIHCLSPRCHLSTSMPIPKWCAWFRTIPPLHDLAKITAAAEIPRKHFAHRLVAWLAVKCSNHQKTTGKGKTLVQT